MEHVLCGEWKLHDRVVFQPHNGAGPCGPPAYGIVICPNYSTDKRRMLVIWDDDPDKIHDVPAWNERFQRLTEEEYRNIKKAGY